MHSPNLWSILFSSPLMAQKVVLGSFTHGASHLTQCVVFQLRDLVSQHGMVHHHGHYQVFQVIFLLDEQGPSYSFWTIFPLPSVDLGFQFWSPRSIPYESSSTSFVCEHPFNFEMGSVVILSCYLRSFGL